MPRRGRAARRAGRRALRSGDLLVAAGLLQRAADLTDPIWRGTILVDPIPGPRPDRARRPRPRGDRVDRRGPMITTSPQPTARRIARCLPRAPADVPPPPARRGRGRHDLVRTPAGGSPRASATATTARCDRARPHRQGDLRRAAPRRRARSGGAPPSVEPLEGIAVSKAEALVWLMISAMYGPLPAADGLAMRPAGTPLLPRPRRARSRSSATAYSPPCSVTLSSVATRSARGRAALTDLGLELLSALLCQEAAIVEQFAGDPARGIEAHGRRPTRPRVHRRAGLRLDRRGDARACAPSARRCRDRRPRS